MSASNEQQSGLIAGHAQYITGAAVNAVGNLSGSNAWSASGEEQKKHAIDAMKEAGDQRDPRQGYGKAEEIAGKLSGCEGMQKEGAASKQE